MPVVDEYLQASVTTAGPWRLHLMVVERAINHSRNVVKLIEMQSIEDAHYEACRAREFVIEIISALRDEAAPELVASVKTYFLQVHEYLRVADLKRDLASARQAVELLDEYRETWLQLGSQNAAAG